MDRIKVKFKKSSPYSQYGYYETGETGDVIGFTQGCAIILKGDGSFVKAEPNWIEEVKDHTLHELAESEDEEIRRLIKNVILKSVPYPQNVLDGGESITAEDAIAWLEKQGEQKPIKERNICDTCDEQAVCIDPCTIKLIEKQKPWSEEDERMLNSALWHVKNSCGNQGKNSGEFEVYNWLKSLKDRVQPQPKQEWSEEDKRMINKLLAVVKLYYAKDGDDLDKQSCSTWLKSLRPNHWKPSDEQMVAFETAIKPFCEAYRFEETPLGTLYNDLKKLREE